MSSFGVLNWLILVAYVIGNLLLGNILSKRVHTAEHYYLGQRTTPWWAIGFSVIATYIGPGAFLGGPAWSYSDGFSVIFLHINYPIAIFVVITVFLPFFYNSGVASIFDYLERRFGVASRTFMSAVFLLGNAAYSGLMLFTAALVIEFITGIDVVYAILIVGIVALTYTMLGGISAVIWTDVIQSVILGVGGIIVVVLLVGDLPGPLQSVLSDLKARGKLNPFEFSLDPTKVATVWTGVIAMSVYHVVVYGVNQMMIQRSLAARTLGDAKKSYIMMGYAAFFIYILFFGLGVLFFSFYDGREFDNGNLIILEFTSMVGIPGMMGLFSAAVVAAAMPSLDSSLNSMATVSTIDFYQKFFKKDGSEVHYLRVSRWITVGWAIAIILPAIAFTGSSGSIFEILSKIGSFFVGSKLAMFGLGFFSKHTSERGLIIGVVAGFLALVYVELYMDIAWPWYCALGAIVSIAVAWTSSILLDGFKVDYSTYTVRGQKRLFKERNLDETNEGWYVIPGRVDRASYWLLGYFLFCVAALWIAQRAI